MDRQHPTRTLRATSESEQRDHQLRESTQYFFRVRFLFLSCRLVQCIIASIIIFFPKTAFSHIQGSYELVLGAGLPGPFDSSTLTQYEFNLGIAGAALLHNFICYIVYLADKALLPFIIYTALVDFLLSNGCIGLFMTALLLGGVGLGLFYKILCILSWVAFLVTAIMEVSLVCIFNHLQNELRSSIARQQDQRGELMGTPIQRPPAAAMRENTPHVRKVRRNVTVESVVDDADLARTLDRQNAQELSSITLLRRQDPTHLSQATTVAEILQEPVNSRRRPV